MGRGRKGTKMQEISRPFITFIAVEMVSVWFNERSVRDLGIGDGWVKIGWGERKYVSLLFLP